MSNKILNEKAVMLSQHLSREAIEKTIKAAQLTLKENPNNFIAKRAELIAKKALTLLN